MRCTLEYVYEHRLRPPPDRIILARLQGAAIRHAVWREPTERETAAAVADLRKISTSPELLAETAGLLQGFGRGALDQVCAASYCIAAGADPDWVWFWVIVGHERRVASNRAPWQDWEPSAPPAPCELPLVEVRTEFAGLPLLPHSIIHVDRGLQWKVTAVTRSQTRRTGRGEEVADWRYELQLTGPMPGAPSETGEFAAVLERTSGGSWGMRPAGVQHVR